MDFITKETLKKLENSRSFFLKNIPFPHIVIDNFLNQQIAEDSLSDFDTIDKGWITYKHYNENKRGNRDYINYNSTLSKLTNYLNSDKFMFFLEKLTGYENILADSSLDGGGIHEIKEGGYLNIHTDFQNHTNFPKLKRRLNLLLYFNKNTKNMKNANLELWNSNCSKKIQSIEPILNRCVIFSTLNPSYHGHPQPLITELDNSRKSLALYYYTKEKIDLPIISTNYKPLPTDKLYKKILVKFDNIAINFYSILKRKKLISDETFTKIINKFK